MSISAKKRRSLPKSEFGLPAERKYPVDTKARAANAKARATQQVNKGNLTGSQKSKIDAKADAVLKGRRGKMADGGRVPTAMSPWSNASTRGS